MKALKINQKITSRENSSFIQYMREVSEIPMLTPDQEADLAIKEQQAKTNAYKAQLGGQRAAQEFSLKAEKAWKESDDYGRAVKDLVAQKKNWDKDPALMKQFNDARLRFIKNNLSDIQGSGNVLSADELLKD
jgi:hypothetical protein